MVDEIDRADPLRCQFFSAAAESRGDETGQFVVYACKIIED